MFTPDFEIVHFGINTGTPEDAGACADAFEALFALRRNPDKEGGDSCFTGTQIEWMKTPGRGTHGHIGLATSDLPAARAYLEEKGFAFDDSTAKYFPDGRVLVIYSKEEIGGFAVHLLQR